jgi:hypothetical protein
MSFRGPMALSDTVDAQRRLRLNPALTRVVDAWLAPFCRFCSAHVDALERPAIHSKRVRRISLKSLRTQKGRFRALFLTPAAF